MNCPSCSYTSESSDESCAQCKALLEMVCDGCQLRSPMGAAFCAGCGSRLATVVVRGADRDASASQLPRQQQDHAAVDDFDGQRRVTTIAMSDLSGYTAMCEQFDAEVISEIMGRIKRDATAIIESFGGMVNQFVGDEIVSLFGVLNASDDDARRAVSAALAVHERVAELNGVLDPPPPMPLAMHTAVHTGPLVIENNDSRNGFFGLTGDTINSAARMLNIAGRGQLVIGVSTRALVEPYFVLGAAAHHEVRNKAEPLTIFHVLRERTGHTRFDVSRERGLTTLAGREAELERLVRLLHATKHGPGQLVVISAEAGAGKSRLCFEFVEHARKVAPDVRLVRGGCQAHGMTTSYYPFVRVLRDTLQVRSTDSADQMLRDVPGAVADIDPALSAFTPAYLHLLSAIDAASLPSGWRDESLPDVLQEAIVALVSAASKKQPMILQLDDWHWADEASRTTLLRLQRGIAATTALVVVSQRPGVPPVDRAQPVQIIEFGPLAIDAAHAMIASCFAVNVVPIGLVAKIYERTAGNPFFVEEVCAALLRQKKVRIVHGDVLLVGDADDLEIPTTVQGVVLGRVDALSPTLRGVLSAASVIGPEFERAVLEHLTEPASMAARLEELEDLGFIECVDESGSEREYFHFRHIITQEVTYDTLLVRQRRPIHERIAQAIEGRQSPADRAQHRSAEALARHYRLAGNHDKALDNYEIAGKKASDRRAVSEARHQLRAAIGETYEVAQSSDIRARRRRLTLQWAAVCIFLPSPSQIGLLEEVQNEALGDGDHPSAVLLKYWVNWIQYSVGNQRAAEDGTRLLLEFVLESGDAPTIALLRCHLGQVLVAQNRLEEAEECLVEGLGRPRDTSASGRNDSTRVSGLYCYSLAQLALIQALQGRAASSFETMQEAIRLVGLTGERATEASLHICAAISAVSQQEWSEARDRIDTISLLPEASVSPYVRVLATSLHGYAVFKLGAHEAGLAELRRGVSAHEESEGRLSMCLAKSWLADAFLQVGRFDDAAAMARSALDARQLADCIGEELATEVLERAVRAGVPLPT